MWKEYYFGITEIPRFERDVLMRIHPRFEFVMIVLNSATVDGTVMEESYYAVPHIVREQHSDGTIDIWDDDRKLSYHTFALKYLDHEHCL